MAEPEVPGHRQRSDAELQELARATRRLWLGVRSATAPADRPRAEDAVRRCYHAAGLPPPEQIIWSAGPVALQQERLAVRRAGASLRSTLADLPLARALERIRAVLPLGRRMPIESSVTFDSETRGTDLAVSETVEDAVLRMKRLPQVWFHVLRSHLNARRNRPGEFAADVRAPHERLSALAVLDHYRRVLGMVEATEPAAPLIELAQTCGWLAPHERICWISERQTQFSTDAQGRLHAAGGPSLAYADGTEGYFWKGLRAPAWAVRRPEAITVQSVALERNSRTRRILIDVMTPERYVRAGGARRVGEDRSGILWRASWNWNADAWAAVEVTNGSPEPDGHHKHYFLQVPPDLSSPTEAVAWTYGMNPRHYAQIAQRT